MNFQGYELSAERLTEEEMQIRQERLLMQQMEEERAAWAKIPNKCTMNTIQRQEYGYQE